ncbi:hypothetical protein HPB47_014992 [Ixodes persulcatus]|uniref:Uncharacterized protein n=1 Tax=Ixodes persulcatus TaxID=34615 RepID=A0AC60QVT9_IXOPE|nr:hypothetical protein HPB47_014992 [Ixodes persulcatus]
MRPAASRPPSDSRPCTVLVHAEGGNRPGRALSAARGRDHGDANGKHGTNKAVLHHLSASRSFCVIAFQEATENLSPESEHKRRCGRRALIGSWTPFQVFQFAPPLPFPPDLCAAFCWAALAALCGSCFPHAHRFEEGSSRRGSEQASTARSGPRRTLAEGQEDTPRPVPPRGCPGAAPGRSHSTRPPRVRSPNRVRATSGGR